MILMKQNQDRDLEQKRMSEIQNTEESSPTMNEQTHSLTDTQAGGFDPSHRLDELDNTQGTKSPPTSRFVGPNTRR